jgi:hypothetical protein
MSALRNVPWRWRDVVIGLVPLGAWHAAAAWTNPAT